MAGFVYKKNLNANGGRVLMNFTLADSTTFTLGDAVKFDGLNGVLILWGAGGSGAGVIEAFQKADGSPVTDDGASGDFSDTFLTGASNTVEAVIDVNRESVYSVTADAVLATTAGSDKAGVNFDLVAASDELDESTVLAAGTTASFVSLGVDNDPAAADDSVLVKIQESQLDI